MLTHCSGPGQDHRDVRRLSADHQHGAVGTPHHDRLGGHDHQDEGGDVGSLHCGALRHQPPLLPHGQELCRGALLRAPLPNQCPHTGRRERDFQNG